MGIKTVTVDGRLARCADHIISPAALIEGHADSSIFKGCFPRAAIYPTDKDYSVEVSGHLLEIEFKKDGTEITRGQMIRIDSMMHSQQHTVIVAWHAGPLVDMNITHFKLYPPAWLSPKTLNISGGLDRLMDACRWWGAEADRRLYSAMFSITPSPFQ